MSLIGLKNDLLFRIRLEMFNHGGWLLSLNTAVIALLAALPLGLLQWSAPWQLWGYTALFALPMLTFGLMFQINSGIVARWYARVQDVPAEEALQLPWKIVRLYIAQVIILWTVCFLAIIAIAATFGNHAVQESVRLVLYIGIALLCVGFVGLSRLLWQVPALVATNRHCRLVQQ